MFVEVEHSLYGFFEMNASQYGFIRIQMRTQCSGSSSSSVNQLWLADHPNLVASDSIWNCGISKTARVLSIKVVKNAGFFAGVVARGARQAT